MTSKSPFRAFFIGGGAYTLPRAWLAQRQNARIHVAEVDPAVTRVARDRMWLPEDDRLTIVHGDARRVLAAMGRNSIDIIVGDAFHDISVPQHLVTSEFFSLVHDRLAADGIYLMNVVDHLDRPRLVLSIVKSLEAQFPVVEIWRSSWSGARATFVIAGLRKKTPVSRLDLLNEITFVQTFERIPNDEMVRLTTALKPFVLTDDYAPVDRLIAVH